MKMNKENVKKDDGRNLFYYTFEEIETEQDSKDFEEKIENKEE